MIVLIDWCALSSSLRDYYILDLSYIWLTEDDRVLNLVVSWLNIYFNCRAVFLNFIIN